MRERVWGSPDVGRVPGCVRMQGTLPGSIWKRGMWRGVATQVRTHRTHGTQEMRRLCQDATPTDQTQAPFLLMHLIPGTVSLHLDTPISHVLVHGIPTSKSLADIATELTTFNTGLSLTGQPRWLTTDDPRASKSASTVVISIMGPRVSDYVGKHLAAFSSTYRTERRLSFNVIG